MMKAVSEQSPVFGVSDFVAALNQTMEFAYPYVSIEGEVSNFRVSKNKWVYFDLKDESAIVRCFAVVYQLSGPLEDGMVVRAMGSPRLHPLYNFTFTVQSVVAVGEGSLKRQADILLAKLEAEGLFDTSRKRLLPRLPTHIALITAGQSAAYADFTKILRARWGGVVVDHYDVLVQGESAPEQLIRALAAANAQADVPEVIVMIRGGGSAEDLAAFSDERVVRAVAQSRIPTMVAIGHEVDVSLAELAADVRASTPSNAAELLVPDKQEELYHVSRMQQQLDVAVGTSVIRLRGLLAAVRTQLNNALTTVLENAMRRQETVEQLLVAFDPRRPFAQGFALVRKQNEVVRSVSAISVRDIIWVELSDGNIASQVKSIEKKG